MAHPGIFGRRQNLVPWGDEKTSDSGNLVVSAFHLLSLG
jgi:hypothetical protein